MNDEPSLIPPLQSTASVPLHMANLRGHLQPQSPPLHAESSIRLTTQMTSSEPLTETTDITSTTIFQNNALEGLMEVPQADNPDYAWIFRDSSLFDIQPEDYFGFIYPEDPALPYPVCIMHALYKLTCINLVQVIQCHRLDEGDPQETLHAADIDIQRLILEIPVRS